MSVLLAVTALVGSALATPPTVTITSGPVAGTVSALPSGMLVNQYLGIPFAMSPPLRFAPPQDPEPWTATLHATAWKPACIQQFNYPAAARNLTMKIFNNPDGPPPFESEDCLYLNVYTPSGVTKDSMLPVLFWIYGGDLQFGDAGIAPYDGSSFAANQDVIVVSANYRTNVFGYSNSPQIPHGQQNSGFLDQRKALQWVQDNIASFGGDPAKVTIFGESAGGWSVKQLVAVPPNPLPFRGAIMESQADSFTSPGNESWANLTLSANCSMAASPIDCVRALPASTIKSIIEHSQLSFPPVPDNVTCVEDFRTPLNTNTAAHVPMFIGTNANEGRVFVYEEGIMPNATQAQAQAFLNATFASDHALVQAINAAYPAWVKQNAFEFVGQVYTDLAYTCTTKNVATLAQQNGYTVFRYYFNESFPNTQLFPEGGAYHSSEIRIVFGTYSASDATSNEVALSKVMQKAWADFAKDPATGPGWPALGTNGGKELGDLGGIEPGCETTIENANVDYICAVYDSMIALEPL